MGKQGDFVSERKRDVGIETYVEYGKAIERVGPDKPITHWMLHYKPLMRWLCRRKFMHFGEGAEFRPGAYAVHTEHIWIGEGTIIRPGSMLFADPTWRIWIGHRVLMGAGVHIYVNNHQFSDRNEYIDKQGYTGGGVLIGPDSWIGANSIILPGITIGPHSVIGAGSVVTKSVPAYQLWCGNPAIKIREI